MAKYKVLMTVLTGLSLFIAAEASAQWLNPTLDAQRWDNLRKHQQRQAKQAADGKKQAPPATSTAPPLTRAERQAAWAIHEDEYKHRVVRDGYPSADRWFQGQARAMGTRR